MSRPTFQRASRDRERHHHRSKFRVRRKSSDNYCRSRHGPRRNDSGDLSIEDSRLENGTYVNQELVKGRMHLERGDIVQVGGVLFEWFRCGWRYAAAS